MFSGTFIAEPQWWCSEGIPLLSPLLTLSVEHLPSPFSKSCCFNHSGHIALGGKKKSVCVYEEGIWPDPRLSNLHSLPAMYGSVLTGQPYPFVEQSSIGVISMRKEHQEWTRGRVLFLRGGCRCSWGVHKCFCIHHVVNGCCHLMFISCNKEICEKGHFVKKQKNVV